MSRGLQNRAVRVLTNTCYDADANQLLKELGWDNLETRRQKLKAEMVYKSLNTERSYKRQGHAPLKHFVGFLCNGGKSE